MSVSRHAEGNQSLRLFKLDLENLERASGATNMIGVIILKICLSGDVTSAAGIDFSLEKWYSYMNGLYARCN